MEQTQIRKQQSELEIVIDSLYKQSESLDIKPEYTKKLAYVALVSVAKEENKQLFEKLEPFLGEKIQRLATSDNSSEKTLLTALIDLHKEHKISKRLSRADDIVGPEISKCISILVTQAIEDAFSANENEIKRKSTIARERKNDLQTSIKKTKIMAYSHAITAIISAGISALTVYFSTK